MRRWAVIIAVLIAGQLQAMEGPPPLPALELPELPAVPPEVAQQAREAVDAALVRATRPTPTPIPIAPAAMGNADPSQAKHLRSDTDHQTDRAVALLTEPTVRGALELQRQLAREQAETLARLQAEQARLLAEHAHPIKDPPPVIPAGAAQNRYAVR